MAKINPKAKDKRVDHDAPGLAGGYGPKPAAESAELLLRRATLACLLWEDLHYQTGAEVAGNIAKLVPQVDPEKCAALAVECRNLQKLRHVPLFIVREMARHKTHKGLVAETLPKIILRADELAEFMAIYWKDGKHPVSAQVKKGLAEAFYNFNEYNFGKYRGQGDAIKLEDVMFLAHPKPRNQAEKDLFEKIANGKLATPDTWEVALSTGKDKLETWTRLIHEHKLGALAFLRNLRNMEQAKVPDSVIKEGFETVNPRWLLPVNYQSAATEAPRWEREIENLMYRGLGMVTKLPGYTILIVDVSGSMGHVSSKFSDRTRLDIAGIMAMIASETCERFTVYATAGDDPRRVHNTRLMKPRRGFALAEDLNVAQRTLGGGGIFTRQCLEWIKSSEKTTPDRIMVFSDSQDCDVEGSPLPQPFGKKNYIIDVSSHNRGINYEGVWTAEVSGWSENFINYIRAVEGYETIAGQEQDA